MTQQKTLKTLIRARMAGTGERYTQARAALLGGTQDVGDDLAVQVEAIVLKVGRRSARVRLFGEDGEVTFRSKDVWQLVPGHVAELEVRKRWVHHGHAHASGGVRVVRIDVAALGLDPLPVEDWGRIDLAAAHEPFVDPDPYAPMWRRLTSKPRPAIEFDEIAWRGREAAESGDPDDCPVTDAAELREMGAEESARELLMEVLHDDVRCIDAHAHLGNLEFDRNPKAALVHYEVGVKIGALSLPADEPDLLVPWAGIYNRPYLRCMSGYGLCLWRLGRLDEAEAVFERLLTLNPTDEQGIRMCLFDVRAGTPWEA